jgi:hypothetical protein
MMGEKYMSFSSCSKYCIYFWFPLSIDIFFKKQEGNIIVNLLLLINKSTISHRVQYYSGRVRSGLTEF